jgi:lysophospholipid acyltransferase (LPLAT)-like uncharacterized protein
MPRLTKKIQRLLLIWLGPWIFRLIGWTIRVQRINEEPLRELLQRKQAFLFCVWHGRLFLPVFLYRNHDIVAMVSQHADGEVIARIVQKMGYGTVRGSSTRGGEKAFLQLLTHLKNGGRAAMIPDGPRGPRHHLKVGTILLAQRSGAPLVPITYAAKPCWRFNSWDRMVLPKPFSRAVLLLGEPLHIPEHLTDDELEAWRTEIERDMVHLVRKAEAQLNGEPSQEKDATGAD